MKFPFFSSTSPASGKRGARNNGFTSLDIPAITATPPRTRSATPQPRKAQPEPEPAAPLDDAFWPDTDLPKPQSPAPSAQKAAPKAAAALDDAFWPDSEMPKPQSAAPRPQRAAPKPAARRDEAFWPDDEAQVEDVPPPGTIGDILVSARRISVADARRIVATQIESNEPFGETAIRMGLVTRDDVQFALSRQFAMPRLAEGDNAIDPEVIAAFHPGHALVERLRNLRGQIALRALDATPPLRSLAIMGTEHGVGRSFIAANLATVFAQLGARTLLVDADLMSPRQHKLFRLNNRIGLSSILAGRAKLNAVCAVPGVPGFAVLPAGPLPPNPDDLIARPTLSHFLRRCEHDFDVIVLDTPAWRDGSSARMVAAAAGAAVLLVQEGKTGAADASDVGQELENVNAKLLGVVLNRP